MSFENYFKLNLLHKVNTCITKNVYTVFQNKIIIVELDNKILA